MIRDLYLRFLEPSAVGGSDVLKLDKKKNLLTDSEIDVGFKCRSVLEKEFNKEEQKAFFKSITKYLQVAIEYRLQSKCNMDSKVLLHATVSDPLQRRNTLFADIHYFVDHFKSLLPADRQREENMDRENSGNGRQAVFKRRKMNQQTDIEFGW